MRRRPNGQPSSVLVRVLAFVRRVALLGVALSAAGVPAFAEPDGYVPLGSFALRLRLGFERDASSGVVICEGNGLRITAGAGLSMVLLNGEGITLQRPVLEENGIVYIPSEVAGQIEARAVQASAAARAVSAPPRVASAPLPAPSRAVPCTPPEAGRAAGPLRPPVHPFTVVLDPGHGGEHTGAKGRSGVVEKMVNLDVARRLQRQLEAAGAKVVLTHSADVDFSPDVREDLRRRYEIGNRTVPDLYLSIHSNWAEDSSARGFEIFVRRDRATDDQEKRVDSSRIRIPAERLGGVSLGDLAVERMLHDLVIARSSEGSMVLAREIERRFAQGLRTENRGIKERDFQVIRWSEAPAVLVELEFLSNSRAERDLGSPEHREMLAKLLAESVAVFRARWAPGSDRPAAGDRTGLAARRAAYAQR